jgi:uncharacterized protein YecE (DUF72 family)
MKTLIGTSGFSYPAWKGSFYPEDLSPKKFLPYYASKLSTVEINNTFYRMPSPSLITSWANEVPDGFAFAIKAPQQITHKLRLKNAGEPLTALERALEGLGEKCGPILFQLPPFMKKDVPLLSDFLALVPRRLRAALEFRHPSWFADDTLAALRAHDAALCIADSEKLTTPVEATAEFGYLRLRREDYVDRDVRAWAERIRAQPWPLAFVYFKHEDAGIGPKLAAQLDSLLR